MKRLISFTAALAVLAIACHDGLSPTSLTPSSERSGTLALLGAPLDVTLTTKLATALPSDQLVVIANYDEAANPLAVTQGIMRTGAGVIRFQHLPMVAALATPAQITAMRSVPGVTSIYSNKPYQYFLRESRAVIGADAVHALGYTGKGVGVAILDSGIDGLYNPALKYPTKTVANVKVLTSIKDLVTFGDDPTTPKVAGQLVAENLANSEVGQMGHGTHVAGIVAADSEPSVGGIYRGVAPGARLIGIATGDGPFIFYALAGFDWLLENRVKYNIRVVNNSWGSSGEYDPNDPINVATKKTHDAGVAVVFAAGNCGSGGDPDCRPAGENQLNPYSAAPWVISVAAGCKYNVPDPTNTAAAYCLDPQGRSPVLADFSSRGRAGDPYAHPDITAPGVRIVSTRASTGTLMNALDAQSDVRRCNSSIANLPYYTCASGTSMASPHIAGVIALMIEASKGTLTPDMALAVLQKTATPLAGYATWEVGAGYVNALAAVKAVRR
jgi:serine protease AprX